MPDHILTILAVADLERAARFYHAAFPGFDVDVETPVYVELGLPRGQRLGLYQRDGFARNTGAPASAPEPGRTTATEIYFRCADIEADIARLVGAGARPLSPLAPRPWGDEAAYFADPDANVLVLARPLAG